MKDVDRGHAWLCLIGAVGANFLNAAIGYGSGVIHVGLLDYYKQDVAKTAIVGSVFSNLLCLLGPLGSVAINLTSCRVSTMIGGVLITIGMSATYFANDLSVVLVTYGIMAGTGLGMSTTTALVVLGYSFDKFRSITVGISVACAGAGMFATGPMIQHLIDNYSIKGAFLLLGAIGSNLILCGALMKPSELEKWHKKFVTDENRTPYNVLKNSLHLKVFKNPSFCFIILGTIFVGLPYNLILLHLPNYSITQGYSSDQAAFLVALVGLGSTINRIVVGLASGDGGIDVLLLYFGSVAIAGISTVTFPLYSAYYSGQCLYAVIFGLYSGAFCAVITPLCFEMVGLKYLSTAIGLYFFALGVGGIIGPPIAGLIVDNGGTYDTSFYLSGVSFIFSSILTLFAAIKKKDISSNLKKNTDLSISVDSIEGPESRAAIGSGFLAGSGFFNGSGFLTAPEIFAGSGSFYGSSHFIRGFHQDLPENAIVTKIEEISPLTKS